MAAVHIRSEDTIAVAVVDAVGLSYDRHLVVPALGMPVLEMVTYLGVVISAVRYRVEVMRVMYTFDLVGLSLGGVVGSCEMHQREVN
jgi:hypothetical protein